MIVSAAGAYLPRRVRIPQLDAKSQLMLQATGADSRQARGPGARSRAPGEGQDDDPELDRTCSVRRRNNSDASQPRRNASENDFLDSTLAATHRMAWLFAASVLTLLKAPRECAHLRRSIGARSERPHGNERRCATRSTIQWIAPVSTTEVEPGRSPCRTSSRSVAWTGLNSSGRGRR